LVGIIKSDFKNIHEAHEQIEDYLDHHIQKNGLLRDAYEHDSLSLHITHLDILMSIILILKKYGFFHYNYLERKNESGGSILKCFKYLIPYIKENSIHFEYLTSIFVTDKEQENFGNKWDPQDARGVIEKYKSCHKKIEEINKLFKKDKL
jgi:hypothetical protein